MNTKIKQLFNKKPVSYVCVGLAQGHIKSLNTQEYLTNEKNDEVFYKWSLIKFLKNTLMKISWT